MSAVGLGSWNPLRTTGTPLPPRVLLACKLQVVVLYFHNYHLRLPPRWLPMWEWLDRLPGEDVRAALMLSFSVGGLLLLLNRSVRVGCLLAGLPFLLEPIVSRVSFHYGNLFCGCFLTLAGLYRGPLGFRLLVGQFVVMYLGSGLNKLLDPDWRSGHFMEYWLGALVPVSRYERLAALLPDGVLALSLSWGTIAAELALGGLFLLLPRRPRLRTIAIWCAILFHGASVLMVRDTFGAFVVALFAGFVALVPLPEPGSVELRVPRGAGGRVLHALARLFDPDRRIRVLPSDARDGSPRVRIGARTWNGVDAWNRVVLLLPVTYFLLAATISTRQWSPDVRKRVVEVVLALGILWLNPASALLRERLRRGPRAAAGPT